jgi:5-methylcytosine-specific restriction endonuclease McrA
MTLSEEEKKERRRKHDRRYREANREQVREHDRRYREANREQVRERNRRYREANREQVRERNRERKRRYYEANREQERERYRRYREANREQIRELRNRAWHNRRARKRSATDPCQPVTRAIIARRNALFGNVCCFCGAGGKLTMEHVVALAKGGLHVPSNLAPSCWPCNNSKNDTPVEAWYPRQPFFNPECWEFLQAHTGNRWSVAEQLTLFSLL